MTVHVVQPTSSKEMAEALRGAVEAGRPILLRGAGSKTRMGGAVADPGITVETVRMDRLLDYEPRDLTIGVEAGMPWRELTRIVGEHRQELPLDPPLARDTTVGGVVAANCAGPRRRLYGSARDLVIGMECATVGGEVITSGGMVVKNVAGYDLQKLMIGSFGTLAAITRVNFKLSPAPERSATFALAYDTLEDALRARSEILRGALQPVAFDLLNPRAAAWAGLVEAYVLLLRAGGSERVLGRYERDLAGASRIEGQDESALWTRVGDFAPEMTREGAGVVVRAGFAMQALGAVMAAAEGPAVARAASGLAWLSYASAAEASAALARLAEAGAEALIEWSGPGAPAKVERWPGGGAALDVMRELKKLFDPRGLLNPGRLHGRI